MEKFSITAIGSKKIALAAVFVALFVVILPVNGKMVVSLAHAQDCCSDFAPDVTNFAPDVTSFSPDVTSFTPDTTSFAPDQTIFYPDTTSFTPDQTTFYPDTYSSSGYSGGYSAPSSYGSTPAYMTPSFYASTPSYAAPSYYTQPKSFYTPTQPIAPSNTLMTNNGNTNNSYNPCANPNSCSTYDNGNTINSNNPTTDTCIYSGSCSTDNHSVVNANTTISSPTTVTISNPAPVNSQIVYNTPSSYAPAPTPVYYPTPVPTPVYTAPVCTTCGCNSAYCPHPVAYNNPATPYVTLSQVPYTGLDLGPIGTVVYWSFLVLFSLVGAYLIVVKRAYRSLATSIGIFLFGSTDEDESEAPATPVVETLAPMTSTPVATRVIAATDYTDDFILTQIKRA